MAQERVIVFGGSGFVGSHTADKLTEKGYDVTIFDKVKSPYLKPEQKMIIGSFEDKDLVFDSVKDKDYVYNFAAIADIGEAMRNPVGTVKVNIYGNVLLLEASRQFGIKRYIFASTVYVYGKSGGFYRVSKQACEEYIDTYNKYYNVDYTVLRYGTLYGLRAGDTNSVKRFLKEALKDKVIKYRGDGTETREYINIEDAARLSVDILDEEYKNQHVVLVGHNPMKVKELLSMIREILGNKIKVTYRGEPMDDTHYKITPHTFNPKTAHKLVSNYYIDMGQGLLNCIHEIYSELKKEGHDIDYLD
jgi:UDP-glucose 4-epimerase